MGTTIETITVTRPMKVSSLFVTIIFKYCIAPELNGP